MNLPFTYSASSFSIEKINGPVSEQQWNIDTTSAHSLNELNVHEQPLPALETDRNSMLTNEQLMDLLDSSELESRISNVRVSKPRGGQVYVLNTDIVGFDYKCDNHMWRNNGSKHFPKTKPQFVKTYYTCSKPNIDKKQVSTRNFRKNTYRPLNRNQNLVIVHYLGSEDEFIMRPHGNSKKATKNYVRTAPSTINKMKNMVDLTPPATLYKSLTSSNVRGDDQGVLNPRNIYQVQNMKKMVHNKNRLSKDEIDNVLELSYRIPNFVWNITLYPDLVCILGEKEILKELDVLLKIKSDPVSLYYDTTFNLGDFYVSTLTVRHVIFQNEPCVPVAYLIHKRKFQKCHEMFFMTLLEQVPSLSKVNHVALVTDREKGITNAIRNVFPNLKVLHCWNHVRRDLRYWLQKHGAKKEEIPVYSKHLNELLSCSSWDELNYLYAKLSVGWSEAFLQYFNNDLKDDVINHSVKFVIDAFGLYNPKSGITSNVSESMNRVLKDLVDWKRRPIDAVFMAIFHLQKFHHMEIRRGMAGLGNYKLKTEYSMCSNGNDDIPDLGTITPPDDIVKYVKELDVTQKETNNQDESVTEKILRATHTPIISDTGSCEKIVTGDKSNLIHSSITPGQISLANKVLENKGVCHVPDMRCFMVKDSSGDCYSVQLHPQEICQCPSTGQCYHIIAAKLSIGITVNEGRQKINLGQLKRNSGKRQHKTSGCKVPRKCDYSPAPVDSICNDGPGYTPQVDASNTINNSLQGDRGTKSSWEGAENSLQEHRGTKSSWEGGANSLQEPCNMESIINILGDNSGMKTAPTSSNDTESAFKVLRKNDYNPAPDYLQL